MTTITAHAGALNTVENTEASLRACLAFVGRGIVEVDLRFTSDGKPALSHHAPVGEDAFTLEECFALAQGYEARFNLDLKEARGNIDAVRALIERCDMAGRAFFTGLRWAGHVWPVRGCGIPWYLNVYLPQWMPFAAAIMALRAKALGAVGLNMPCKRCSENVMRAARRLGLLVSVWTVDEPEEMARMLRLGVDNITTRHPDVLREMMDNQTISSLRYTPAPGAAADSSWQK